MSYYFSGVASQKHIVLGVPGHNRKNYKQKKTIGVFTTMTPLNIELRTEDTFASLLSRIGTYQRTCLRHQKFPNSDMARLFSTDQPFYDLSFNYLKLDYHALRFSKDYASVVYQTSGREKTPLTVTVWDGGGENLELQLDFNHGYFSDADIQQLAERLDFLLSYFTDPQNWQLSLTQCPLIKPEEQAELSQLCNTPDTTLSACLMHEFVEQTAEWVPNSIALRDPVRSLSYRELNEAANRLAHFLMASKGSPKEQIVGICQTRSVDMVISVLAVLKAGMAYVPLDPQYPKERLSLILSDAQPQWVLCHSDTANLIDSLGCKSCKIDNMHALDSNPFSQYSTANISRHESKLGEDSLAYLIYTSGSTGKPKGVAIEHRNASAMIDWAVDTFSVEALADVLVSTSLNFDLSIFEMFVPLAVGGSGTVVENVLALSKASKGITLINTVPSAVEALLAANCVPDSVQVVNLAGEQLPGTIVNNIFANTSASKVYNLYGPSEDTTYSTCAEFTQPVSKEPHIGKVISNSQAYILNSDLQLLPRGAVGELYLGGAGVARGYLNRSELTAERFIPASSIASGELPQDGKVYKSGDLVKISRQGFLEYIGRIDDQVKIRGHRIELTEIQTHLSALSKVKNCLTVAKEVAGSLQLVAYCQSHSNESCVGIPSEKLKVHLSKTLPEYMVPSFYVWLTEWPLTPNGKIDKSRLPLPNNYSNSRKYVWPESETEQGLVRIWANLLEIEVSEISSDADFFELGGHSILAMRMAAEASEVFQSNIGVTAVFTHSNLRQLSSYIDANTSCEPFPPITPLVDAQGPLLASSAQQRLWLLNNLQNDSQEYNMAEAFKVSGTLELDTLCDTLLLLIERHTILRTIYKELNSDVFQVIQSMEQIDFEVAKIDFSAPGNKARQEEIKSYVTELDSTSFDLGKDLMLKVTFITLPGDEGILHFNLHHIAADGWSIEVLINEMVELYEAKLAGYEVKLAPLTLQYADFAQWQRKHLAEDKLGQQLSYWQKQLSDMPLSHGLPTRNEQPVEKERIARRVSASLPAEFVEPIRTLASDKKLTPFMLIHAALALVLAGCSQRKDIVIATPLSQRPEKGLEATMGFFINILVLRVQTGDISIDGFLQHVKATSLAAHNNKDLPFESLLDLLDVPRTQNHSPLFQIMLTTSNDYGINKEQSLQHLSLGAATLERYESAVRPIKCELEIEVRLSSEGVEITCDYDSGVFEQTWMQSICDGILNVLSEFVEKQQDLNSILPHQLDAISWLMQMHYLKSGKFGFSGAAGEQVKVQGFSVELGEIETHIVQHEDIAACSVALKGKDSAKFLVAYCQLVDSAPEMETLSAKLSLRLRERLPEYMLPSSFVSISAWPLTDDGQIDKVALPTPQFDLSHGKHVAPETDTETAMIKICADLLQISESTISTTSNFFELGGHSLMLLKLKGQIEAHFSVSLTFKDVAEEGSIKGISSLIDMKSMRLQLENSSNITSDEVEVMDW